MSNTTAVLRDAAVNTFVQDYRERPVFERLSKIPRRQERTGDAA